MSAEFSPLNITCAKETEHEFQQTNRLWQHKEFHPNWFKRPKPAQLRLGREPETETPPPPRPMQMGHICPAVKASQQRTRAAGRMAAHQSPAQRLHPIPTPGKSHCRTLACDHTGIRPHQRWTQLHRGLLPWRPTKRGTWGRGCSPPGRSLLWLWHRPFAKGSSCLPCLGPRRSGPCCCRDRLPRTTRPRPGGSFCGGCGSGPLSNGGAKGVHRPREPGLTGQVEEAGKGGCHRTWLAFVVPWTSNVKHTRKGEERRRVGRWKRHRKGKSRRNQWSTGRR